MSFAKILRAGPCSLAFALVSGCGAGPETPSSPPAAIVSEPADVPPAAPVASSAPSTAPSAVPTAAPQAKPAEPPPPDPSTPLGQCALLRGTIKAGRAKQSEITVLVPHADQRLAELMAENAANVGKLTLADASLAKLAAAFQKALEADVAAIKPLAKAIDAGSVPSAAVNKRVKEAAEGERKARQAIEQYCVDLGAPPP